MAYQTDIKVSCDYHGCKSQAKVEVFDTWNGSIGKFCRKHGTEVEKRQQRSEAK